MGINELVGQLYEAKLAEQAAKEYRLGLEAQLAEKLGVPEDWEGTQTRGVGLFRVKLSRKMNVKIDTNRLREQARVNNILPMVDLLFRWKPELNKEKWNMADEKVKLAFAPAIEVTPGKASFSIERMEG
jgi:hypothetical protein